MAKERTVYLGPRLKRLRRELGLTQADMAADLEISSSYIALLERNQRPLTADLLLRLARIYKMDIGNLAGDGGAEYSARLQAVLKDPMFTDIDLPALEIADVATSYPGFTEALLRIYTAYQEEQLVLADRGKSGIAGTDAVDPVAEAQHFIAARRNCFPRIDEAAERLAQSVAEAGGLVSYFRQKHNLRVRRMPDEIMQGSIRRYDRHREEVLLDESLDIASQEFQLALQVAYIEMRQEIDGALGEGHFATETGRRLVRRALANHGAAALRMPYTAFAKAAEKRSYDIEALARQFGTSFEQAAHRLTTLQKPGQERVPFFFIRVDPAGNVSKRLDGAGFPFARHGGACPLWSLHLAFQTPGRVLTQWLELPDGKRFFSIARTVSGNSRGFGSARVEQAIALACAAEHAPLLIYAKLQPELQPDAATPIGVNCRLCQRIECLARSAPPIGRQLIPDDFHRAGPPFSISDI
jgi:XRE family transcriptional regulator, fatty acid utilization regulator